MRLSLDYLASSGLIKDTESRVLPVQNFSSLLNLRIDNHEILPIDGYGQFGTPVAFPYYLMTSRDDVNFRWFYPTLTKIYMTTDGTTHWDVSEASNYTGDADDRWNGDNLNGLPILNNGVEEPQYMADIDTTTKFAVLPGWDSNWKANVVRVFRNFIFAFNIEESGTVYPLKVRWSSSADVSGIPTSWTSLPTNDAGSTSLAETRGRIVDAKSLGDSFIIYKEDSAFLCQYTGGDAVFRFSRIRTLPGMLAQDCCCEFPGGHFVIGNTDIYIHDGQTKKTVCEGRVKDYFYESVDKDAWNKTFAFHNERHKECWACFALSGELLPSRALIWNYETDIWTERELPPTSFIVAGVVNSEASTWGTIPGDTWDAWPGSWGTAQYSTVNEYPVAASTKLFGFYYGYQANGVDQHCDAISGRINIGDFDDVYRIKTIYPKAHGDPFTIRIGSNMSQTDNVNWEDPVTYTPDTDHKIDVRCTGRLYTMQFESEDDVSWSITGYDLDVEKAGSR